MHCTKCGASVSGGATFCPACGTPVPAGSTPVAARQASPAGVAVPNYMVGAILTTLFCCLIGGIVAIIYSSQVNTKLAQGDVEGAKAASKSARTWIIVNLIAGLVVPLLFMAAVAVPNFVKYRNESQAAACISNMKQIETAGEVWLTQRPSMTAPTMSDLCGPEESKYIKTEPTCPKDGSHYSIRLDDGRIKVTCGSGDPEHILPRSGYEY